MKAPLENRIEEYLNKVAYLSFTHSQTPYAINFIFETEQKIDFLKKESNEDLRDYFRGRNIKLVIYTPNDQVTEISLVDTKTADTIRLKNMKFITQNLLSFTESKIDINSIFMVIFMCFVPDPIDKSKKIAVLNDFWTDKTPLKIHGYSLIDTRTE